MSPATEAPAAPEPAPPEETLAYEAAHRVRAAAGAAISAIATLAGFVFNAAALRDRPRIPLVDALRDAAGQPLPGREGLRTELILFLDEKATQLLIAAVFSALAALSLIVVLGYLYRATRARRPQTPSAAIVTAVSGAVMAAVGGLVLQIGIAVKANDFAGGGNFSSVAGRDVFESGFLVAGQIVQQVAVLALGFAFVMISLNAMRAGLLTRFMGILGIIVGVLSVIPFGAQQPVVQVFWLLALAALIAGRWPGPIPPAWSTGRAEPWPTQQDLREARDRARAANQPEQPPPAKRRKRAPEPDPEPEALGDSPEQLEGKIHPSSKKKKRRRH